MRRVGAADFPVMTERVHDPAQTPAIRLISNRIHQMGSGSDRLLGQSVRIIHDERQPHRGSIPECCRAEIPVLRRFVRHKEDVSANLEAATTLLLARGYAATSIRAIAEAATVSVPTVELAFASKPRLLKAAIDVAIAGDDQPVPMLERDWARGGSRIRA